MIRATTLALLCLLPSLALAQGRTFKRSGVPTGEAAVLTITSPIQLPDGTEDVVYGGATLTATNDQGFTLTLDR